MTCMSVLYFFESDQESSFTFEIFSLLNSGICLNGVQIANSSRISDRRFEYLRPTVEIGSTAWKVSKYGVSSYPYFSAFGLNAERCRVSLNTGKYRPAKTPSLETFYILIF